MKEGKPTHPCPACGATDWRWPPDSYVGKKVWICNRCHPDPARKEITMLDLNRAHTQYKAQDGNIIPSVTTVLKILDKPGLVHWAWECGMRGEDYREVQGAAAKVGTLAHYLIMCHLRGETPVVRDCSAMEMEKPRNCFAKYLRWEEKHCIKPVMIETPLVSEEFKYGGTPDLLAALGDEFTLVDFKTGGSGVYPEMFYQLAAYRTLLEEQGWPVASARILRISADGDDFEEVIKTNLDREFEVFRNCLNIFKLQSLEALGHKITRDWTDHD